MAYFYTWETKELTLILVDSDRKKKPLAGYDSIVVSIVQADVTVSLTDDRLTVNEDKGTITFTLSQTETSRFKEGYVDIQVNVLYDSGERDTSVKGRIEVRDNLYKQVMS